MRLPETEKEARAVLLDHQATVEWCGIVVDADGSERYDERVACYNLVWSFGSISLDFRELPALLEAATFVLLYKAAIEVDQAIWLARLYAQDKVREIDEADWTGRPVIR